MSIKSLSQRYRAAPGVMIRKVGDDGVLLDVNSGVYYGLNAVGVRVWECLISGESISGVVRTLQNEFDVDQTEVESDIDTLVGELQSKKLIEIN